MDYLDKPRSDERGSRFNRRHRAKWVRIQPALTPAPKPAPFLPLKPPGAPSLLMAKKAWRR
jgi:hypothetical protein